MDNLQSTSATPTLTLGLSHSCLNPTHSCFKVRLAVKRLAVRTGPGVRVYRTTKGLSIYYPRTLRNDVLLASRRLKQGELPSLAPAEHLHLVDSSSATTRNSLLLQLQNKARAGCMVVVMAVEGESVWSVRV